MTKRHKRNLLERIGKNLSHFVIHDVITTSKPFYKKLTRCDVESRNGNLVAQCSAFIRGRNANEIYGVTAQHAVQFGETYYLVCKCYTCNQSNDRADRVTEPFEAVPFGPPEQGRHYPDYESNDIILLRPTAEAVRERVQHIASQSENVNAISRFTLAEQLNSHLPEDKCFSVNGKLVKYASRLQFGSFDPGRRIYFKTIRDA